MEGCKAHRKRLAYRERIVAFVDRTERRIRLAIAVLIVLTIVFQVLLTFHDFRYYVTEVDRLEGVPAGER